MNFYLLDVKSVVNVDGVDVPFDYVNTYLDPNEAYMRGLQQSFNEDVLEVSVHRWVLEQDGNQRHDGGDDSILYRFLNDNHRELRE